MSWIFLFAGLHSVYDGEKFGRVHGAGNYSIDLPWMYLACGGLERTLRWESVGGGHCGWVQLGGRRTEREILPLEHSRPAEWLGDMLEMHRGDDDPVAMICWRPLRVDCAADALGLRDLYFASTPKGVCVSSRLDWVARAMGLNDVDFFALEGRWQMFNASGYESGVRAIQRAGPGGSLTITGRRITAYRRVLWRPEFGDEGNVRLIRQLDDGTGAIAAHGRVTLGLSGGMDSRVLLASLAATADASCGAHTFGDIRDPDVAVALGLAERAGIPCRHFVLPAEQEALSSAALLCRAADHAAQNFLTEPVSSVVRLPVYEELHRSGALVIDGGFGEIARGQYHKRAVWLGRNAVRRRDAAALLPLLRHHRAPVFIEDAEREMNRGCREHLAAALEVLPAADDVGVGTVMDLYAVQRRFPNYGGPAQAYLDGIVPSMMPLAHPAFLRAAFAARPALRRNGAVYRAYIRSRASALAGLPLVKSGVTYPFGASRPAAWFVHRAKSMAGIKFHETGRLKFLATLRNQILDIAHSAAVATWPAYDHRAILRMVNGFHAGHAGSASAVDWWLTFELWRRSLDSDGLRHLA